MTVPRPRAEVFGVFENPRNLAMITPKSLGFEVLSNGDLTMGAGLEIDYRFRWLGLPMRWRTRITEYDRLHHFVDEGIQSPYRLWRHLHEFSDVAGGTEVRDTVRYALPLGALGRVAHAAAVKRQLLGIFTYRQRTLNDYWGGNSVITWPTIRAPEPGASLQEIASPATRRRVGRP
jgi:ligand-binding SRPBCC domain-containing protein